MKFIKTTDWQPAAIVILDRLKLELAAGRNVLWLLSGGSNVSASVQIMKGLETGLTKSLTILLVDERYGPPGHVESNDHKLDIADFDNKSASRLRVLSGETAFENTQPYYEELTRDAFSKADVVVAQLGIGPDGHIAGILPHSPAVVAAGLIAAYTSDDYRRLTLTAQALKQVTVAYVLAFGTDKLTALEVLAQETVPYADQPAQILKQLPEVYVFSDQLGEQA